MPRAGPNGIQRGAFALFAAECEEGYRGMGADAHGQRAAQTDVHIQCLTAFVIPAIALGIDPLAGCETHQAHLHRMGVAAQREGG